MTTFRQFLKQHLETHPAFAERWRSNKPMRDIIAAIIKARIDRKLTQADVAGKAHCTINDVHCLESGNGRSVGIKKVLRIADALGLKMVLVAKEEELDIKWDPDATGFTIKPKEG